jgi:hypothetical protein
MQEITYNYLLMSQKSLLKNEVIEELLRERAHSYSIRNKNVDFWLLISPNFIYETNILNSIKKSNFYKREKELISSVKILEKNNFNFFASLISTDANFIRWIKLRIGYFEDVEDLKFDKNLGNFNEKFVSNGIFGTLKNNNNISPLHSNQNYLDPSILIDRYKKSLKLYYLKKNLKSS